MDHHLLCETSCRVEKELKPEIETINTILQFVINSSHFLIVLYLITRGVAPYRLFERMQV